MQFAHRGGFVVRILRSGSATPTAAGIGFVVGERHVITCAHVINTALGRDQRVQGAPGRQTRLQIDFPILTEGDAAPSLSCYVDAWLPPPPRTAGGISGGDIGGLIIVSERLPAGAGPARLIRAELMRGAEVNVFGYPADAYRPNGAWAIQRLRGGVGGGIIQLDVESESALRAQRGYSGSPVVVADSSGDAVVGMLAIVSQDDGRDAYAIPISALAAAWPSVVAESTLADGGSRSVSPSPVQEAGGLNSHATGGAMVWDTRINPVVHALSQVINDLTIIRDIAVRSGLSMAYVRNAPDAASYWTAVLDRAQDEGDRRVDSVLNEALARTESPMVHDAVETYWKARGR